MTSPRHRRDRKFAALILILLVAAVLWAIRVHEEPRPPISTPAPATSAPITDLSPRVTVQSRAPRTQDVAYDFAPIRSALLRERLALAGCLMRNQNVTRGEFRMTLTWAAQGKLERVLLLPDAGDEVRSCLSGIASQWALKPHASLQPFSYTAILRPR